MIATNFKNKLEMQKNTEQNSDENKAMRDYQLLQQSLLSIQEEVQNNKSSFEAYVPPLFKV